MENIGKVVGRKRNEGLFFLYNRCEGGSNAQTFTEKNERDELG